MIAPEYSHWDDVGSPWERKRSSSHAWQATALPWYPSADGNASKVGIVQVLGLQGHCKATGGWAPSLQSSELHDLHAFQAYHIMPHLHKCKASHLKMISFGKFKRWFGSGTPTSRSSSPGGSCASMSPHQLGSIDGRALAGYFVHGSNTHSETSGTWHVVCSQGLCFGSSWWRGGMHSHWLRYHIWSMGRQWASSCGYSWHTSTLVSILSSTWAFAF